MSEPAPTPEDRRQICAALVLDAAADGPAQMGVFTDEELIALDGLDTVQLVPLPWIVDNEETVERRISASIALRSLIARRLVLPAELLADDWDDLGDDPRRLYAADPVQGILTLRRSFTSLITFQRMVSEQIYTVVQYVYDGDTLLEEEITADGYHHFHVLPKDSAVDHAVTLIDQDEVAGEDGEPITLRMSAIEEHVELGPVLSDTRALTVASLVTRAGEAEQLTFYATSDRMYVSRSDQDVTTSEAAEDPELEFVQASTSSLRDVVRSLLEAGRVSA